MNKKEESKVDIPLIIGSLALILSLISLSYIGEIRDSIPNENRIIKEISVKIPTVESLFPGRRVETISGKCTSTGEVNRKMARSCEAFCEQRGYYCHSYDSRACNRVTGVDQYFCIDKDKDKEIHIFAFD